MTDPKAGLTQRQMSALRVLAEKERQIQEQNKQLEARLAEMERREQAVKGMLAQLEDKQPDPMEQINGQVSKLTQMLEQQRLEQEQRYKQQAWDDYQSRVIRTLQNSEDFPLLRELQMYDSVLGHIKSHLDSTGQELSEVDAAREVEAQLSELVEQIVSSETVKSKFLGTPTPQPTSATTLTDTISSETATYAAPTDGGLYATDDASVEAAAALLKFSGGDE